VIIGAVSRQHLIQHFPAHLTIILSKVLFAVTNRRFSRRLGRKIGYSGINLSFEHAGPARRRGGRATAKFDQKGQEA
jgi:hypothetical protein